MKSNQLTFQILFFILAVFGGNDLNKKNIERTKEEVIAKLDTLETDL